MTTDGNASTAPAAKRHKTEDTPTPCLLPPIPPAHFEQAYLQRPCPPQPEFTADGAADADALAQYKREGFLVIRGLLGATEVQDAIDQLQCICDKWEHGERPGLGMDGEAPITPLVDFDPDFKCGRKPMPKESIDAVRRFFRLAVHDEHFRELVRLPKLLAPLKALWGNNVAVLQSMALCKPPGSGEKRWHADMGYFRLEPPQVAALWIALDPTDVHNGCMYIHPGSHLSGTPKHGLPPVSADGRSMLEHPMAHIFYSAAEKPPADQVFAVPMTPGDALLFDGNLLHFTPPNDSYRRRRALQFHYASAECIGTSCSGEKAVKSTNVIYGPLPKQSTGFDCAPAGKDCVEPQFWYYRKAEIMASGERCGDECI